MAVIEIETIEGGRMKWVGIYRDTDSDRAVRWGDTLLAGFKRSEEHPEPNLRLLDKAAVDGGVVIGSWQAKGFNS